MDSPRSSCRATGRRIRPISTRVPFVREARPDASADPAEGEAPRPVRAVYGAEDLGALDHDLTKNAVKNGEPLGERMVVTGRVLDEAASPCATRSSRYGRRTRPAATCKSRPARRAARPELPRCRPLPDRRRRPLPLPDDQARRIPVGQPSERVAPESHPLLAVRRLLRLASRHADVLPRRPAARVRPDLPGHARGRTRSPDLALLDGHHRRRLCARLRIRHRAARRDATRWSAEP